jgi:hypothetical protein
VTAMSEIIKKICEKLSRQEGYQRAWLEKHWAEVVGKSASRHSMPRMVRNQILYVNVDSSTWNQALFIEKRRLVQKVNQCFISKIIHDLKFQMGNDGDFSINEEKGKVEGFVVMPENRKSKLERNILTALHRKKVNQNSKE